MPCWLVYSNTWKPVEVACDGSAHVFVAARGPKDYNYLMKLSWKTIGREKTSI